MKKTVSAAFLLALAGMTARASAEPRLSGFAAEVMGNRVVSGLALRKAPVGMIKAGGVDIALEKTTLGELAAKFGGSLQQQGDANDVTFWLCYLVPGKATTVLTFASGEVGSDDHPVTMASVETTIVSTVAGCVAAPPGLSSLDLGIPGLGASLKAATAALGEEQPDAANRLKYNATTADEDGSQLQTLTYRLQSGVVTGAAVTQVSTD